MPQLDVEVFRYVSSGRDFVSARASGQQFAVGILDQFFGGEPSQALHKPTFDLTDVDRRVE